MNKYLEMTDHDFAICLIKLQSKADAPAGNELFKIASRSIHLTSLDGHCLFGLG